MIRLAALAALGSLAFAAPPQSTTPDKVGFRVGPRIGLEFHDDPDLFVGGDMRLSFPMSPLTINPTFDRYFDEDKSLFHLGVDALYYLPIPTGLLDPYVGPGIGVTGFSFHEGVPTTDDVGYRIGLNLVGGVCFDVPMFAPFAQVMVSIGEIDLVTSGGGILVDFGRHGRGWDTCGRRSSSRMKATD